MKKIILITMIALNFTSLHAVKCGSYYVKKNTAGDVGGNMGSTMGNSFAQSFNDAYYETIRKQRELEQYENKLRIQMQIEKEYIEWLKQLDERNSDTEKSYN